VKPALLLAALLSCTLPSTDHAPNDCTGTDALTGLAYFNVYAVRQSPTWISKRDSMLRYPDMWTRYWPVVRAEAAEVQLTRTRIPAGSAGKRYEFTPALRWTPAWVRVRTEDDSSNVSCPSPWRYVP